MRKPPLMSVLPALGVALLAVSCSGDSSALEDDAAANAEAPTEAEEYGPEDWAPITEDQLAQGLEMPDCVTERADNILVPPDFVADEEMLAAMCGDTPPESGGNPDESSPDRQFRPSQWLIDGPDGIEVRPVAGETGAGIEVHHLRCEDSEALEQKAEHNGGEQPAGWPQDWDGEGAMPDPYCHPDYLEIGEWDHLEAHFACWEGIETSTIGDQGQSQDDINKSLWEQSQARAAWEPNPAGGTCAEQWAENDGGDPEDYSDIGNADEGGF